MTSASRTVLLPCPECDLVSQVRAPQEEEWLRCPRCHHPLARHARSDQLTPALAVTALMLLAMAMALPYIGFEKSGLSRTMTLLDTAGQLAAYHHPALSAVVLATIVVLPACYLLAVCWIHLSLLFQPPLPGCIWLARQLPRVQPWMMADVFAIAALVSLIKIIGMAEVHLLWAFWAFTGYALMLLLTVSRLNTVTLWGRLLGPMAYPAAMQSGLTAREQGLTGCPRCGFLQPLTQGNRCQRCQAPAPSRKPQSSQRVWALLGAAVVCCFPAHLYPIMVTQGLGQDQPSTIIAGVMLFIEHGDWPIALIIFTASVLVPFAKILALGRLEWATRSHKPLDMTSQMRLYRLTEWIGRWSMIDVFVVAIIVALVQLGNILSIAPGPGGVAFAGVVILTMLAANSFDPRRIWDQQQRILHDRTKPGHAH